ncbi:hypothetical protein [Streptomyces sp. NRRL F-2664]|uniref:hypothetical protein n=1 Tax=Streptomyces sp. NRRL F-2664 TaxID=1463842 RepID=UPI000A50E60C|nr:hypothetical protein [Streptomyces sp. NRRL F-2664]
MLSGLAANPALPAELVDRLIRLAAGTSDAADELVGYLADRTDLSPDQVAALAAHDEDTAVQLARGGHLTAGDVDPAVRPSVALALLDEGCGWPQWAVRFAADPDPCVRRRLASCPGLPPEAEDALAGDADLEVTTELALWTTSPPVAARLARHPHAEVRRVVAANEAVPPAALAALLTGDGLESARSCLDCEDRAEGRAAPFAHRSCGPDPAGGPGPGAACDGTHGSTVHGTWRRALANPATPPAAVAAFADHPSEPLRWAVARHPGLPAHVRTRLAEDPAPGVRAALAGNPGTGAAICRRLAADPDPEVRRALAHHPRVPFDVLARLVLTTRTRTGPDPLPRISSATPDELAEAAASARGQVRMLVAQRRDLPPDVRNRLASDEDASVAKAVAPHPGLPAELLRGMVALHGVQVLAGVAANPDAPADLLAELAHREPPVRRALREIASHPNATAGALMPCLADRKARVRAAAHPALPPAVVVELLDDTDPAVVEAAAANPALPSAVMRGLLP